MLSRRLCRYRVVWRRVGEFEIFTHEIAAGNPDQAARASSAAILRALGPNSALWIIDHIAGSGEQSSGDHHHPIRDLLEWLRSHIAHRRPRVAR